jgi:hypothetical protein
MDDTVLYKSSVNMFPPQRILNRLCYPEIDIPDLLEIWARVMDIMILCLCVAFDAFAHCRI